MPVNNKEFINVCERFGDQVLMTRAEFEALAETYPDWNLDKEKFHERTDGHLYYEFSEGFERVGIGEDCSIDDGNDDDWDLANN